jgi:hypothetical protein
VDVVISGSSGLIGTALRQALTEAGHRPVALVRRTADGVDEIAWDIDGGVIDAASLEGIDAVVNLAGAGIGARRWNAAYKRKLVESRTRATALLATTLAGLDRPPSRLLSGSAIGYYGDRGDEVLTESSGPGEGFLTDLCQQWEGAAQPASDAGIATAFLRTGLVMTGRGGILTRMLPLFKLGLGGRLGSGRQYQSWITLDDEVGAILHLLDHPEVTGPVNLTAPEPVTNRDFTGALGAAVGRPTLLPVPAFGPKVLLGPEMAGALLFDSARVEPSVLTASGFEFRHRHVDEGLKAALGS